MKPSNSIEQIREGIEFFEPKQKSQCEFVITRYQENLEWTNDIEHLCTVYNKGNVFDISGALVKSVPNQGVGLETVLRHIIEQYNSLADVTFFCQGTVADRTDQPIYPFKWYFENTTASDIKAMTEEAYDLPTSRYMKNGEKGGRTLQQFRNEVIGIPYKNLSERWVRGDWIAVGRNVIRSKPKAYYEHIYRECHFERGIFLEECYFLERSLYSIFTRPLEKRFQEMFQ